jgi:DNA-directed RNA polymerase specialized sigma subunit
MTQQVQEYYRMTHAEIAQVIGVSRGMVNHIEKQAMAKIKKALEKRGLKLEDIL